jgi:hypothetical protein
LAANDLRCLCRLAEQARRLFPDAQLPTAHEELLNSATKS